MRAGAAPAVAGQVVLAVVLGSAVALAVALVLTVVNAVAGRDSPAGPPEGGLVAVFLLVAAVYGAVTGVLVGVAGAVLLPRHGDVPPQRRTAFVVISCVIAATAIGGLAALVDLSWPFLVVLAVLVVPALVIYLRRYAPR